MVHTVTRLSQIFSLSVEESLRPKFRYLTEELGGDVKTCVKFPAYFSLSLDQRIRPRHTYMQRLSCAPDPFPMKYLSENDEAFAGRARRSLNDYVSYKVRQFFPLRPIKISHRCLLSLLTLQIFSCVFWGRPLAVCFLLYRELNMELPRQSNE